MPGPSTDAVSAALKQVVDAMQAAGVWAVERPADEAFADSGAFGMKTMAFVQWLRWVLVPNVEKLVERDGPWPSSSQVAVMAMREGDTDPAIASLVPTLAAFDALFGEDEDDEDDADEDDEDDEEDPDEGPSPELAAAREAYQESFARLESGDRAGARQQIERALALEPLLPNAENHAGWVLFSAPDRSDVDVERAIEHFRTAAKHEPMAIQPLVNLADALLASGKKEEAVATMEQRAGETPANAAADHWLGWWFSEREPDLDRALVHARRAASLAPSWGLVRSRLAWILEKADLQDEAYREHAKALDCEGDHDRAFSHERRGAHESRSGWFRNALRSLRRARREDRAHGGQRTSGYDEAIAWVEAQLRARSIAVPEDTESAEWDRACELELPPEVALPGLPAEVLAVEKLVRESRFDQALEALRTLRMENTWRFVDAIDVMDRAAELARAAGLGSQAIALLELVEEAHRIDASGASAAGEAYGCLGDAERTRERIARWSRELGLGK